MLRTYGPEEVYRGIEDAMKFLEKDKVTESFTGCFIDKMLGELSKFHPMNIDAQLWSNTLLAKIIFNRVKLKLSLLNNTA